MATNHGVGGSNPSLLASLKTSQNFLHLFFWFLCLLPHVCLFKFKNKYAHLFYLLNLLSGSLLFYRILPYSGRLLVLVYFLFFSFIIRFPFKSCIVFHFRLFFSVNKLLCFFWVWFLLFYSHFKKRRENNKCIYFFFKKSSCIFSFAQKKVYFYISFMLIKCFLTLFFFFFLLSFGFWFFFVCTPYSKGVQEHYPLFFTLYPEKILGYNTSYPIPWKGFPFGVQRGHTPKSIFVFLSFQGKPGKASPWKDSVKNKKRKRFGKR